MVSSPAPPTTQPNLSTELAECGWRTVIETHADGTTTFTQIPLTPEEFLHPKEDYRLPNSTFHDDVAGHAKDVLTRRYASDPTVGVYRDLLIEWDIEGQKDLCPDTFVAFGISNKDQNRSKFIIANEGARPAFILEVVSPRYRKEDREKKVLEYARTQVPEYVIVDRRRQRGELVDEVLGYRLVEGIYQPIAPDEDGRILCETVGVLMSLQEGQLVIEDAETGERLLSSLELEAAKESAEQQAAEMAALLEQYRERFGEL
ncbi:Uma2 family endonuclease [Lusitaniella coriacea LEGE 07157]|uniref:Uma2 family endonuclease n=1 Tax=Lusitaniella coriacea LEGE 07157 TaxID=945747 RepID=A0A8J7DXZ6_9CYAN|nr:Uma2 family endonuclease [Lusitaniella coriacea]MBE9117278.1 Uma2 family endonuclease [Lusitaniella coriacea LEGE 07157]